MDIITLYKYDRDSGKITVSPEKPNCDYTEMCRIIADEGKAITKDGVNLFSCIDVDAADGWYEVELTE